MKLPKLKISMSDVINYMKSIDIKNKVKTSISNFRIKLKDKEYQKKLAVIGIGTLIGSASYAICLVTHFDIFGWNLGLVLSPLIAGYVETFLAQRYLKESSGAISAFILFIITVIYGFLISNPTLGFNIITFGSILIILQAAIPTAVNFLGMTIILAFITTVFSYTEKFKAFLKKIYYNIFEEEERLEIEVERSEKIHTFYDRELEMNKLGVHLLTIEYPPEGMTIIEHKGIYETRHVFSTNPRENIKAGLENYEENLISIARLAQDKALLKLIKKLKSNGCNGILNLNIRFETLGPKQGNNMMQVAIRGTGVIFEEEIGESINIPIE